MHRPFLDAFLLGIARVYAHLWHRWSSNGPSPVPATGPAILVSNHTCSADPTFLLAGSARVICFAVASEHINVHPLARRLLDYADCVPVTRNGRDTGAARRLLRRLAEGWLVCIFPEGNLSGVARNCFGAARHGAAFLALVTRAPVFPVYIAGGPHTDRLLQSWLLPSRQAVRVHYGPPIDLSPYYGQPRTRRLLEEVTRQIQASILELRPQKERKHLVSGVLTRRSS
jgi:1-acyl-sn-glycerol-3-phosphate acyltransferase